MKKTITTILAVTLLLINNCFSQGDVLPTKKADTGEKDKGYIGIGIGLDIPMGTYAGKVPTIVDGVGYAKVGPLIDISLGRKLYKGFGIAGLFRTVINPLDKKAIETNEGANYTVTAKPWLLENLMIGGYGSFNVAPKFSIETRVLLGVVVGKMPEIKSTYTSNYGSGYTQDEKTATAASFGFLLGAGFKYDINNKMCFLGNLDFLTSSKLGYNNIEVTNSNGYSGKYTASLKYSSFNIGIGLGFKI